MHNHHHLSLTMKNDPNFARNGEEGWNLLFTTRPSLFATCVVVCGSRPKTTKNMKHTLKNKTHNSN